MKGRLFEMFIIPPFSIFDTKQGYWQNRKKVWINLGIKSELGRSDIKAYHDYKWCKSNVIGAKVKGKGTSIFDPVLCELMYSWFCPENGHILDPFAGGSVRGIVASMLKRYYTGIDLNELQIIENRKQAEEICDNEIKPIWFIGDSRNIKDIASNEYDFIFSCPPYFDLEVYSDNELDLSMLSYEDFLIDYKDIICKAVSMLKENRFACFVVSDIRDKNGFYRNFVSETISGFIDAGMKLYNEAILVNTTGSLPIRIAGQFVNRKLGKMHQNVLIFYKGNVKEIKNNYTYKNSRENLQSDLFERK